MRVSDNLTIFGLNTARTRDGRQQLDGSACVYSDGKILAVPEERVTRFKYDGGVENSIRMLSREMGIDKSIFDLVAASTCGETSLAESDPIFVSPINALTLKDIGLGHVRVMPVPSHHLSHACLASIYACFGARSLISIYDYEGSDSEVNSHYLFVEGNLHLISKDKVTADGRGGVGSAVHFGTKVVGMNPWRDAGKFCGLASSTKDYMEVEQILGNSDFSVMSKFPINRNFVPPSWVKTIENGAMSAFSKSVQKQVETSVLEVTRKLILEYSIDEVLIGGGVANNCKLVGFLQDELADTPVKTSYAPGDSGQSIGNVIWALRTLGLAVPDRVMSPFLTPKPFRNYEKVIGDSLSGDYLEHRNNIVSRAVSVIESGRILATFIGSAEFGPRALGARSFLIRSDDLKLSNYLNGVVKKREEFRPFGVILDADTVPVHRLSPFMDRCTSWGTVSGTEASLCGCRSVDGSIRYQTTSRFLPSLIVDIVKQCRQFSFEIINTSLNGPDEPTAFDTPELLRLLNVHPSISLLTENCLFESINYHNKPYA